MLPLRKNRSPILSRLSPLIGRRPLRKKMAAGVALVVLLGLVSVLVEALNRASPAVPLRVGMTVQETDDALRDCPYVHGYHSDWVPLGGSSTFRKDTLEYNIVDNSRGELILLHVTFDQDDPLGEDIRLVEGLPTGTSFPRRISYPVASARNGDPACG
jgi:hypothetical protein